MELEPPELSGYYGFDVANFVNSVNICKYRKTIGVEKIAEVLADVFDFENCEESGRC